MALGKSKAERVMHISSTCETQDRLSVYLLATASVAHHITSCRLQLHPLPASLDLSRLAFPVSFATWPEGSSARFQDDYHWQGTSDDGHFIPDAPFFHGLEVSPAKVEDCADLILLKLTRFRLCKFWALLIHRLSLSTPSTTENWTCFCRWKRL